MVNNSANALDAVFHVLSDPTRRGILEQLVAGESSVTKLAEPYNISLPAISKHLRVIEKAGLISREKDGRVRRCRLDAGLMKEASDWITHYRRFWEQQLDSLAVYFDQSQADHQSDGDGAR